MTRISPGRRAGLDAGIASIVLGAVCLGSAGPSAVRGATPDEGRRVLFSSDLNAKDALPGASSYRYQTPDGGAVTASAQWEAAGTIDAAGTDDRSGALRLRVNALRGLESWGGALTTGRIAIRNTEPDLAKLTLAFDLSASAARPVLVRAESFDAEGRRGGGREIVIHPAAPRSFQRFALEVSAMAPAGAGSFDPLAPQVQFTFEINGHAADIGWPDCAGHELCVDNLSYAAPAWYVSPSGDDRANDGRGADSAFATPQHALDVAQPGDVILLMDGLYRSPSEVSFPRAGTPAAWITLKNHPGHHPVLTSDDWHAIKVGRGTPARRSADPALAYLEVRGLRVRGTSAEVEARYAGEIGQAKPSTNGNGISIEGRHEAHPPHHLRIADCEVFECSGGGITAIYADWVSIEGNRVHHNCRWMIYAGSGISVNQLFNFDESAGYRTLIRNNHAHDNACTQPWIVTGNLSDGNGIIVDYCRSLPDSPKGDYAGRILVQGNLSYRNGGSGMHAFQSDRVDFINNTASDNNTVMDYGQLSITTCGDCRVLNNIITAPAGKALNRVNGQIRDVLVSHNLFFGGNRDTVPGAAPIIADPLFRDAPAGDYHPRPGSPALGSGGASEIHPTLDLDALPRRPHRAPDRGALGESSRPAPGR